MIFSHKPAQACVNEILNRLDMDGARDIVSDIRNTIIGNRKNHDLRLARIAENESLRRFLEAVVDGRHELIEDPREDEYGLTELQYALNGIIEARPGIYFYPFPPKYACKIDELLAMNPEDLKIIEERSAHVKDALRDFVERQRYIEKEADWQDNGPWSLPINMDVLKNTSNGIHDVWKQFSSVVGIVENRTEDGRLTVVDVIDKKRYAVRADFEVGTPVVIKNRQNYREATESQMNGGFDSIPDGQEEYARTIDKEIWDKNIAPFIGENFAKEFYEKSVLLSHGKYQHFNKTDQTVILGQIEALEELRNQNRYTVKTIEDMKNLPNTKIYVVGKKSDNIENLLMMREIDESPYTNESLSDGDVILVAYPKKAVYVPGAYDTIYSRGVWAKENSIIIYCPEKGLFKVEDTPKITISMYPLQPLLDQAKSGDEQAINKIDGLEMLNGRKENFRHLVGVENMPVERTGAHGI